MAAKARIPAVELEFGGETRRLIFDFNALAELEEQVAGFDPTAAQLKLIRASVWAGLLADSLDAKGKPTKRTLSLQEVGDLVSFDDMAYLNEKITEAMNLAKGALRRSEVESPLGENPPTGKSS